MKNNILIIILVLVAIAAGYYFVSQRPSGAEVVNSTPTAIPTEVLTPTPAPSTTVKNSEVKEISVVAKQWAFVPGDIKVNQGDRVRLKIKSVDVEHGFSLPDYNINVKLQPGKEEIIEFIADKKGTFDFNCNVPCGTGHRDMTGKLTVV